jgi:DNA-binding FadR family transcriptional regulator
VDRLGFYEADIGFHRAIWELADNKYLIKALEILSAPQLADVVTRQPADKESLCEVVAWHEKMLNCLTEGSADDIEGAMHYVFEGFKRHDRSMYALHGEEQEAPQAEAP